MRLLVLFGVLHNSRARYLDEMSCFFGFFLRAVRVRVRVCLVVVRCLDEMPCFLAAEFCCWWCDVRTMERCVLKEAGDWVYTMVYWTLRGFECASLVVRWRGNECNLGGGGWCKCKCVGRQKGFVWKYSESCHQQAWHQVETYVCLRMTSRNLNMHLLLQGGSLGGLFGLVAWCLSQCCLIRGFFLPPFCSCALLCM